MGKAISIHAPLTGSDALYRYPGHGNGDFNPRSPYGERRLSPMVTKHSAKISIHAPLTGSDQLGWLKFVHSKHFNPRSPYGERLKKACPIGHTGNFNPRSPYGERRVYYRYKAKPKKISIHAPLTGSDDVQYFNQKAQDISIHAPLTGSDNKKACPIGHTGNFNPRSPYGERQIRDKDGTIHLYFNPRSPYGERRGLGDRCLETKHFNPRSPYGERPVR